MKIPKTITELRKALPGWQVGYTSFDHIGVNGHRVKELDLYNGTVVIDFRGDYKARMIPAAYAAAMAWEKP